MKIRLISPKLSLRPMDTALKRRMSPSLALLTLAALTPEQHTITIEDYNTGRIQHNDTPDLVGITVTVDSAVAAYAIADDYKRKNITVVLGGIHVSANPEEALCHADAVCIGEGGGVWPAIINDAENNNLKRRYYGDRYSTSIDLPPPRWDLIDKSDYLYTNTLTMSDGCPYNCSFCYNSCDFAQRKYRVKPIANVLNEIKAINCSQIMFIDDNFIGNIEHTRALLAQLKPLHKIWHAAVSADIVHYPDILDLMAESGCQSLFIGIESINPQAIQNVNKVQNKPDTYGQLASMLHDRNIMFNASLVFGFDHDTKTVFKNTLEWLIKNRIESMTAHILTPYPGTELFKVLEKEQRILTYDWGKYNTAHAVFKPKHMNVQELEEGYQWMYRSFYSWANIWRRLPVNHPLRLPYLMFNIGYRKLGWLTSGWGRLASMKFIGKAARKFAYGIE